MGWDGGGGGLTVCKRWGGMEVGEDSLYVRDGVGWRWGEDSLYVRDGVGWRWGRTHCM